CAGVTHDGCPGGLTLPRRLCRPRHDVRRSHGRDTLAPGPRPETRVSGRLYARRVIAGASEVEMAGGRRKARPRARRAPKPAPIALEPVDLRAALARRVPLR